MATLSKQRVQDLQRAVVGSVHLPGTPGYDEAVALWNGAIHRRPAAVVQCKSAADVAAVLRYARDAGHEISVRGGGHGFSGSALTDGGITIDLSLLREISVLPLDKRATVGGGATWAELDAAAQEYGLAVPGGFISHTGIGGLTLGGGLGWLSRKAGLSCDNVLEAQVVTADGTIRTASATENPDLFWAIRGGGGNFGVVTSFTFALTAVGPMVNLGMFFVGLEHGADLLRFAREITRDLPDDVGVFMGGLNAPPEEFVPRDVQLQPGYALALVGLSNTVDHAALVERARAALPMVFELVTPIPYVALQQMFNPSAPWGIQAYEKAVHLDELTDAAIEVIARHVPLKSSPMSFMPMFCLGGAYGRVEEDATAFGGSRTTKFVVNIAAIAPTPELLAVDIEWARAFWSDLVPHASGIGGYVNFMAEYDDDRVRAAYGAKYDRLAGIKATYDPDNVFHINANIRPSA
jgi:FAD/FMN-containing dehydrogenase